MEVEIKEVTNKNDLKRFIRFPDILYKNNPYRVPPLYNNEYNTLQQEKNPAFEHCEAKYWLAYKQDRIVGRIAGIINHLHIEKWQQNYIRFGWIDFIDDPNVSEALMKTVEFWAMENGMTAVHGPLGFTDHDPVGLLVEGFNELGTLATTYNYHYYVEHLERVGYKKDTDWVEYEIFVPSRPIENYARIAERAMQRYKLRKCEVENKKELQPYTEELFKLLGDSHKHLYGVVPLTKKQVYAYIKQYYDVIKPNFLPIILDENNHIVAFGFIIPSLSRAFQKAKGKLFPFGFIHIWKALNRNNRADLCLVAVKPELQGKGLNAILIHNMIQEFNKLGIVKVESNPELETNKHVQGQWKYFEKRQHKRRRCYIKYL